MVSKALLVLVILMMGFPSASFGQVDWNSVYDNTYLCFGYKIHVFITSDSADGMVTFRDQSGHIKKRFFMPGRPDLVSCENDPLGLHVPVAIFLSYTGGAHCCQTYSYWSMGENPINLLTYDKGDEYDVKNEHFHEDLDGDGKMEIISMDNSFSDFLSYWGDYPLLRIVFCYKNGKYDDCTAQFSGIILREINRLKMLKNTYPSQAHLADIIFVNFLLINEEEKGLNERRKELSKKEIKSFTRMKSEIQKSMQTRKSKLKWVS